jgi:hypothetical protein
LQAVQREAFPVRLLADLAGNHDCVAAGEPFAKVLAGCDRREAK